VNYGFDLEGTIDACKDGFLPLMAALVADRHGVLIMTGVFAPATNQTRMEDIKRCGLERGVHYTELYLIDGGQGLPEDMQHVAQMKRDFCHTEGVVMFWDDRKDWCDVINETTHTCWFR
jgi:hypothetical protein